MLSALLPRLAIRMNVLLWIPEPSNFNIQLPRLLFDDPEAVAYAYSFLAIANISILKDTILSEDREAGTFIRERGHVLSRRRFKPSRQIVLKIQRDDLVTRFYEHRSA